MPNRDPNANENLSPDQERIRDRAIKAMGCFHKIFFTVVIGFLVLFVVGIIGGLIVDGC